MVQDEEGTPGAEPSEATEPVEGADEEREIALELSTEVSPGLLISIDDVEFEVRTIDSLSKVEEAKIRMLSAKENRYDEQLRKIPPTDERRLEGVAGQLRGIRISMIVLMSNIPTDKVEALPITAQQRLIALIGGTGV